MPRVRFPVLPSEFSLAGNDPHNDHGLVSSENLGINPSLVLHVHKYHHSHHCALWFHQTSEDGTLLTQLEGGITNSIWRCDCAEYQQRITCAWCATNRMPASVIFTWLLLYWKRLIYTLIITSNKPKLTDTPPEFQFVFITVRCSYIFISCVKMCQGSMHSLSKR
jgi:hypothetical protein